jgi:hypothetical protein
VPVDGLQRMNVVERKSTKDEVCDPTLGVYATQFPLPPFISAESGTPRFCIVVANAGCSGPPNIKSLRNAIKLGEPHGLPWKALTGM